MNLQKKYLCRFSQYICAITDIKVHQNCTKLRPTRICMVKQEKRESKETTQTSIHYLEKFTAYIALNVVRFSSKKESSIVINLEDNKVWKLREKRLENSYITP